MPKQFFIIRLGMLFKQIRFKRRLLALLWLALLSSCLNNNLVVALNDTLRAYENTIRWGNYTDALRFTKINLMQYREKSQVSKSIRVTHYQEKHRIYADDSDTLTQIVEISYYDEANNRVKTIERKQVWHYDDDEYRWYLSSGLPIYD